MYRLLIADDERTAREGLKSLVDWSIHGIEIVAECGNGAEAVEATMRHRPDVAIVDVRMPFVDGIEYCRRVRSVVPRPRVVIASAYDKFEYAQAAIKNGVCSYLLKPYDEDDLLQAVLQALHLPLADAHGLADYPLAIQSDTQDTTEESCSPPATSSAPCHR